MPSDAQIPPPFLQHPSLSACAPLAHAFLLRAPDTQVTVEKAEAVARLTPHYQSGVETLGFQWAELQTAEQTHGSEIAVVEKPLGGLNPIPVVDGLLTNRPGVLLGIMVADCCAISLVDPQNRAIALLHSGKRGTEANIAGQALAAMRERFQTHPQNVVAQLSPCIRPPHYEVDIAATIRSQVSRAGVPRNQIHDERICTAQDADRFYSYRREKGFTGRMLALLGYPHTPDA